MPGRNKFFAIGVFFLLFIIYGSLLPFEVKSQPLADVWSKFIHIRYLDLGMGSRADWVANLLLYIPPAFFLSGWLDGTRSGNANRLIKGISVLSICTVVAFAIEFMQHYFPPRTVSANDLIAEFIGTVSGILLWHAAGNKFMQTWMAIAAGGRPAIQAGLLIYGLSYFLLGFFPFDFVISFDELRIKLAGENPAIWSFGHCESLVFCVMKYFGEIVAVMPFGVYLAMVDKTGSTSVFKSALKKALLLGLGMGMFLELGQVLLISGVSNGVSVLTRGVGVVAGLAGCRVYRAATFSVNPTWLRWALILSCAPYLLLLGALNHWFSRDIRSLEEIVSSLKQVSLIPFYYHYYTTEVIALQSLVYVAVSYVPVALAIWLFRGMPAKANGKGLVVLLVALLVLFVEASKLLLASKHPDLTNILIGTVAAVLAYLIACWVKRWSLDTNMPGTSISPPDTESLNQEIPARDEISFARLSRYLVAICLIAFSIIYLSAYPVARVELFTLIAVYGLVLWRYPLAWIAAIPAVLPVLDLTPWSGRIFVTEFDVFLLFTFAFLVFRSKTGVNDSPVINRPIVTVALLFLASSMISFFIGMDSVFGLNSLSHYYSSINGLRSIKSFIVALLILYFYIQEVRRGVDIFPIFCGGMLVGLFANSVVIIVERWLYTDIFDFSTDFRPSGLFSGMHTGDAYLDVFIVTALPFVYGCFRCWNYQLVRPFGVFLFVIGFYSLLVTFSRSIYLAIFLQILFFGIIVYRSDRCASKRETQRSGESESKNEKKSEVKRQVKRQVKRKELLGTGMLVLIPVLLIGLVWSGSYIRDRFQNLGESAGVRSAHWLSAIKMMDSDPLSLLFGMGPGSFPRNYFWNSIKSDALMSYQYEQEGDNHYLRLGAGKALYLGQRIKLAEGKGVTVSFTARSNRYDTPASMPFLICEKAIQHSFNCQGTSVELTSLSGDWKEYRGQIDLGRRSSAMPASLRPVELSFFNRDIGTLLDIDDIRLISGDGKDLLKNGNFDQGADHWFMSSDNHLAWHAFNMWVHVVFEYGLAGVGLLLAIVILVIRQLWRIGKVGSPLVPVLTCSLVGFLSVGLFNSLLDDPRIFLLFFLILWPTVVATPVRKEYRGEERLGGSEFYPRNGKVAPIPLLCSPS